MSHNVNQTENNDWCTEEEVLPWLAIIWISVGYTRNPETLSVTPEPELSSDDDRWVLEPIPADFGGEAGYTLDKSPVHRRADGPRTAPV